MIPCSWKSTFGIECLTCGFQRSCVHLAHGEMADSISAFPATIPFLLTILIFFIHITFKLKHGARLILVLFSISAVLMAGNYGIKIYDGEIFHHLNH